MQHMTYIWTGGGFVYLASIMDLYSRKLISWTLGETLETKWVLEAVEKAKGQRHVTRPLVIHSDCGVQYTCKDYEKEDLRELLEDIMERIQEFREEMLTELDDLEDMIVENSGTGFH